MQVFPRTAWAQLVSSVTWGTLGSFVALSRQRRHEAMLEALHRVVGGDLQPLSRVMIHSLKRRAELNGARGICLEFQADTGRWLVQLYNGCMIRVKKKHLQPIGQIVRPMASIGSSRGTRQIFAALPVLIYHLKHPQDALVRELFNHRLVHLFAHGQGGIVLAMARVAGMSGSIIDTAPVTIQHKACCELSCALRDACQHGSAQCPAHLEALGRAIGVCDQLRCSKWVRHPGWHTMAQFQ